MGNENCPLLPCQSQMTDITVPSTPKNAYNPEALIGNIPPCQLPQGDINKFPYKNIGVVLSLHPKNKTSFQGTGFLISEDLVLTCAHNICNVPCGRKKHDFIRFYPAVHGKLDKYHKATIAYIPDQYLTTDCNSIPPFDYALLKLDEPVSQTQFLTIGQNFEDFTTEAPISIFGYPSSKKFQEVKIEDGEQVRYMWQAGLSEQNKIIEDKELLPIKRLLYQISTEGGQSGAPIMIKKEGSLVVIGLHQGGYEIDIEGQRVVCNIGRRFTQDFMTNLKIWKQKCNGSNYDSFDYKTFKKSIIRRTTLIREPVHSTHTSVTSTNVRPQSYYVSKYWDLILPFINNFFIEKQTVTRMFIKNHSYYQVPSAEPLPAYSITRFRYESYGGNQSIIVGIVTASAKHDKWSKGLSHGSLGLISNKKIKMGAIFNQGLGVQDWKRSLCIEEGEIVTLEVNKPQGFMSFQRSKTEEKFVVKLGHFASTVIFTFVAMRNKDSAITYLPPI